MFYLDSSIDFLKALPTSTVPNTTGQVILLREPRLTKNEEGATV